MEIYIAGGGALLILFGLFLWQYKAPKLNPYIVREVLVNSSEKKFYEILVDKLPSHLLLFSKVRMEDFIAVNNRLDKKEVWRHRGYVKSRHVDFLLCDKNTSLPLLAIELDGKSHLSPNAKKRDRRVNAIYKQAGLTVTHVKVGSDFEKVIDDIFSGL